MIEKKVDVSDMIGKTFVSITKNDDEGICRVVEFENDKYIYHFHNEDSDCGNNIVIYLEDICGDLSDLINTPIVMAECVSQKSSVNEGTWSFYKFGTMTGYVTMRWCAESNGYYSEEINCTRYDKEEIQ